MNLTDAEFITGMRDRLDDVRNALVDALNQQETKPYDGAAVVALLKVASAKGSDAWRFLGTLRMERIATTYRLSDPPSWGMPLATALGRIAWCDNFRPLIADIQGRYEQLNTLSRTALASEPRQDAETPIPPAATPPAGTGTGEGGMSRDDRKKGIPAAEAEVLVRDWLKQNAALNPGSVTRDAVAAGTGVSAGAVSKCAAWKAFRERRDATAKSKPREIMLTDTMLAVIPAEREEAIELDALMREQAADMAEQASRSKRRHSPS